MLRFGEEAVVGRANWTFGRGLTHHYKESEGRYASIENAGWSGSGSWEAGLLVDFYPL